MRTTVDIDDDVLIAVKELARKEQVSAGRVLSRLAREALAGRGRQGIEDAGGRRKLGGFRPFPSRGVVVSDDLIERLREEESI